MISFGPLREVDTFHVQFCTKPVFELIAGVFVWTHHQKSLDSSGPLWTYWSFLVETVWRRRPGAGVGKANSGRSSPFARGVAESFAANSTADSWAYPDFASGIAKAFPPRQCEHGAKKSLSKLDLTRLSKA